MIPVLIGVAILALLVLVGRGYVTANPRDLAKRVRFLGGLGMVIGGGVLMLTGKAGFGLPLVMFGFTLLGGSGLPNFRRRGATIPPGTSRVKSPSLEMELDHASGAMTGRILAGQFAGRTLDQLDRAALFVFAREISGDRDGLALLEAYLDRRFPGWREDVQADAGARRGNASGQGPITEEEAYQILGLDPGAGAEEIRRAHRALMKKLHPDQGGSTYLAARVNAAKDLLLRGRS